MQPPVSQKTDRRLDLIAIIKATRKKHSLSSVLGIIAGFGGPARVLVRLLEIHEKLAANRTVVELPAAGGRPPPKHFKRVVRADGIVTGSVAGNKELPQRAADLFRLL